MPNALVTFAFGGYLAIGRDFTFPLMHAYAERNRLDFVHIDHCAPHRPYSWDVMDDVYALLNIYQRLLFVSVDCIIAPNARNVLELPAGAFYGFDEYPFATAPIDEGCCKSIWEYTFQTWADEFPRDLGYPTHLYNTGLYLIDRSHQGLFAKVSHETDYGMQDMAVVNMRIHKYQMEHKNLRPEVFNASNIWLDGQPTPEFLHVMWQTGTKYDGVKAFMPRMGYP